MKLNDSFLFIFSLGNNSTRPTKSIAAMPPEKVQMSEMLPTVVENETESTSSMQFAAVSSMPMSMPRKQQKRPKQKRKPKQLKKVAVTIGHDLQGNPIITYRQPITRPIVHLPTHIQTPELSQLVKRIQTPELVQRTIPAIISSEPNASTQFINTDNDDPLETATYTSVESAESQIFCGQNTSSMNQSHQIQAPQQNMYNIIPHDEY